mgnify:CR=1 FL=1
MRYDRFLKRINRIGAELDELHSQMFSADVSPETIKKLNTIVKKLGVFKAEVEDKNR